MNPAPIATVAITTRNRKEDLVKAVESALSQNVPVEVLVLDDASTDGTYEMIKAKYPEVRVERTEQNLGLIEQRNRAALLATSNYLFSIDDDAMFSSSSVVSQTINDFLYDSIGAVAIPYIDVLISEEVRQKSPDERVWIASTYRGTAHALRRDVFLKLGGYRPYLFRQGEEDDYCIRMISNGYHVRLGTSDPVLHYESPKRNRALIARYEARNGVLNSWHNVPTAAFPVHLIANNLRKIQEGVKRRHVMASLAGIGTGYAAVFRHWHARDPVTLKAYRTFRRLRKQGFELMDERTE